MRRRDFVRAVAGAAGPLAAVPPAFADREPPAHPSPPEREAPFATVALPAVRSVLPAVFLASWNEHLEGSAVEWTDEHGYGYLSVVSRVLHG